METYFGIPTGRLALAALAALGVVAAVLGWRAWRWPIFVRLGVRQLPRRPAQTALIAGGLMLSTALVAASLSTGDTLTHSLRAAAVGEVGRLDETVTYSNVARISANQANSENPFESTTFFSEDVYDRVRQQVETHPTLARDVAGLVPAIFLDCALLDLTSHQASGAAVRALPVGYDPTFGELIGRDGRPFTLAAVRQGEVYLNDAAGAGLAAQPGDEVTCTVAGVPHRWRVAAVLAPDGVAAGSVAGVFLRLDHLQESLGRGPTGSVPRPINQIWIANRGDAISSAARTAAVVSGIRPLLANPAALSQVRALLARPDVRAALANRKVSLPDRSQRAVDGLLAAADAGGAGGGSQSADQDVGRLERALRSAAARTAALNAARDTGDRALVQSMASSLQGATGYQVFPVKQQILEIADRAGNVLSTIFLLFSLLSIAASLLLVFLIFSLLAASRRSELGVARALGTGRGHLIAMFTFEGVAYALLATAIGVPVGLAVSRGLVALLLRAVESGVGGFTGAGARAAETVRWHAEPRSVALAATLGLLLTVATVGVSAWRVSRVTIVTAIRDLPEPPPARPGRRRWWWLGLLPAGAGLLALGLRLGQTFPFALGVTCLLLSLGALARAAAAPRWGRDVAGRVGATVAGAGVAAYWALPFDAQQRVGLPRLASGIEIFGLAGICMVAGTVWALAANGTLVLRALTASLAALRRPAPALRLAAAHLLRNPFRTGMTAVMFAMVVFMLTVMQAITASALYFHSDKATVYGGWDLTAAAAASAAASPFGAVPGDRAGAAQAAPLQEAAGPQASAAIAAAAGGAEAPSGQRRGEALVSTVGALPQLKPLVAAGGVRTSAFYTLLQLSAPAPVWGGYTVASIDEGFAEGNAIPLQTRARGYGSDRAAWKAVASGSGLAIIDGNALPSPQLRGSPGLATYAFALQRLTDGDASMEPEPLWVGNPAGGGAAVKVTVIGVIDRRAAAAFRGLHVSGDVFRALGTPIRPASTRYYFKLQPGADENAARAALGAAFFDEGLQTTSLSERFLNESGPLLLASRLLQLFVSLGLFVGIAALGVLGTRAALERRQQIGVLRAIGFSRAQVGASLLLESALLVLLGSGVGVALGLVLCRNVFAVQFFDRFQQGMRLVVPWPELALTVGATCVVALAATWLPARQAARVPPVAALRAE